MSVKIRSFRNGGWEVDIRGRRPDGTRYRERRKSPVSSKTGSLRWAEERERHLLTLGNGALKEVKREDVPTWEAFGPRFLSEYCKAERHKQSGIDAKQAILDLHLLPRWRNKKLDEITPEDVQKLKTDLAEKSGKTTNNILSVARKMLKIALEWRVIDKLPCKIGEVNESDPSMWFYDFHEYERLIAEASKVPEEYLVALLGGEAGLRLGEIRALQWKDINFAVGSLCVGRSLYKEQVQATKGWELRHVPLTARLLAALKQHRHLRSQWVVCQTDGRFLTRKMVAGLILRAARRCGLRAGVHALRHSFCSHLAMRGAPLVVIRELAGHKNIATTMKYMHLSPGAKTDAIRLLDERAAGRHCGDGTSAVSQVAGS